MPGLWTSGGCKPVVELQHMISPIQNRYCRALLIAAAVMLTACTTAAQDAKKPKWTDPSGFEVIGIEARTNNSQESTGSGAIPKQWQRLFMENLLGRIPDRIDQSIVAVYSNYASDWNGDYTYTLGAKVKPGTKAPEGMVAKNIPTGKYAEFTAKRGRGIAGGADVILIPERPFDIEEVAERIRMRHARGRYFSII